MKIEKPKYNIGQEVLSYWWESKRLNKCVITEIRIVVSIALNELGKLEKITDYNYTLKNLRTNTYNHSKNGENMYLTKEDFIKNIAD